MAYSLLPSTFEEIKDYLITKVTTRFPSLGAFVENSILLIFISIIAWGLAQFMDYAGNLFSENHLFSVIRYENARKQAAFYGYIAHRKISANGTIKIGMDSNFNTLPTESITFQQYDSMTINGVDFLFTTAKTFSNNPLDDSYDDLPAGTYYITANVIQGELITIDETAEGVQNEEIEIEEDSIENTVITLTVNSETYTKVDSFFESDSTDKHYTAENLANMTGLKITFGDGYKGVQLSAGDAIQIKHIKTDALEGQIKSVGFDITFNETYTYSDTTPVTFYGISTSQMIGADDIEEIDSIKYWGQKAASSMDNVAFQDDDIQLELQEYGGILKSRALSEYDISPDSPDDNTMNIIRLLVVPTAGTVIDDTTKQSIRNYLRPKMDMSDFIQFIDVEYIDIYFKLDMEVNSNAAQDIGSQIDSYLQTTYELGQMDFEESLNHSDVTYNIKHNYLDYIHRFNLELWVIEEDVTPAIQTGPKIEKTLKIGGLSSGQNNIKLCKIIVDFNDGVSKQESFLDNGSGVFALVGTSATDFLDSGTINYETGAIVLNILGTVVSVSNIEYQYETYDKDGIEENIDIKYNQIIRYNKSLITTEYV